MGLTWKSSERRRRVAAKATTRPQATPVPARRRPWRPIRSEACGGVSQRIHGADVEEQRAQEAGCGEGNYEAAGDSGAGEQEALADEHAGDGFALGSKGDADADFATALRGRVGDDAVKTDEAEEEGDSGSEGEHDKRELRARHGA